MSLNQLFGFGYPAWNFGVTQLPLRDRAAAADYADAVVNKRLDLLRVRYRSNRHGWKSSNALLRVERSRLRLNSHA